MTTLDKMDITFVTSGLRFNGNTLNTSSLGGSETALLCMARAMRRRGHRVRVFCECDAPGEYAGVVYHDRSTFAAQAELVPTEVLIVSRTVTDISIPSTAGMRILWLHDVLTNKDAFVGHLYQTDMICGLSQYHIENYCGEDGIPELRPLFWKTSNGVDMELINKVRTRTKKIPEKLIYTSRPERGLYYLLRDIFPALLQHDPDLVLHVGTYSTQSLEIHPSIKAMHDACDAMIEQYGSRVVRIGPTTKERLYEEIASAQLLLYPTDFPEINCITAIEAQACGTPMITTNDFALPETLSDSAGVLIDGNPRDAQYVKTFVSTTIQLLEDADKYSALSSAGPNSVVRRGQTWDSLASSWESKIASWFSSRPVDKVRHQLQRRGDRLPVALMDGTSSTVIPEPFNEPSTEAIKSEFAESINMWNRLATMLQVAKKRVRFIIDYGAWDVSFGLFAAKAMPDATVVILARDNACYFRIKAYAAQSQLTNVYVMTTSSEDRASALQIVQGGCDLLYVGDNLEQQEDPQSWLSHLQVQFLRPDGIVSGSTRYNTSGNGGRLWNFDYSDLREIFTNAPDFAASFHTLGRHPDNVLFGRWVFTASRCDRLEKINLRSKMRRTRPYQSLSVCMIVRDEAEWIVGALKSVRPIADHIVVVDSGSTDGTLRVADGLVDEWRGAEFDNFAQMRNESVRDCSTDWILWIDADERISCAENIAKYLQSTLFNGFAIRQNHLMLDVPKSFDLPVRLYRNKPEYRFTGLIHEHCEDTSKQPYDDPIHPTLVLPDVDIVHYGYTNERVRRSKCSRRNMELLIRDVQESTGRMLTWVLVLRDYLNIVKWSLEKNHIVQPGSPEHRLLDAACATYLIKFGGGKHRYESLAFPVYQEALAILASSQIPALGQDHPPIEIGLTLTGAMCGLEDKNLQMRTRWFYHRGEVAAFLAERCNTLVTKLGASVDSTPTPNWIPDLELPDAAELLRLGVNTVPKRAL